MPAPLRLFGACLALAPVFASAQTTHIVQTDKLDWQTATKLASDTVQICAERGYSVTAAVVDPTGHQQVVIKGDRVPLQSLSVSYRKAYTAYSYGQAFDRDTTSALIHDGLANSALNTVPEVLFMPGGITLRRADRSVLGGLGVSGAPGGDKDEACGLAAVARDKALFQ